ncbi:MAG TPA: YbaK/EbsC family protein [bacterium]|nr:YbaK/EbsC family protein [bacterium]
MELPKKLTKFLKKHKVFYEVQVHPETFTALETAEAEHVSGRQLVKAVMVKADGKDVMVVLPSNRNVDLFKLSTALGKLDVRIEEEVEFKELFPDCEAGAMPPFGKMYGIPCYADESLSDEDQIYFNAGNHWETIKVSTADFLRVSKAVTGDFSVVAKKMAERR